MSQFTHCVEYREAALRTVTARHSAEAIAQLQTWPEEPLSLSETSTHLDSKIGPNWASEGREERIDCHHANSVQAEE